MGRRGLRNGCRNVILLAIGATVAAATNAQQWARSYGGPGQEIPSAVEQTPDGGFIVAGVITPLGAEWSDVWVLKLDRGGNIQWQKSYGGRSWEQAFSVQHTQDGGYAVAGVTGSFGAGSGDAWIIKLHPDGAVAWQKTYGGTEWDEANSIRQTSDGGYIVAGSTWSFGAGGADLWVLKLDSGGNVQWQKTYGEIDSDYASSIQQTWDGGYIVAGDTSSFGAGKTDVWVLKLNPEGTVAWEATYGDMGVEWANSVAETVEGGCIVAGHSGDPGFEKAWVLRLDGNGQVLWEESISWTGQAEAFCVQQTADGGFILGVNIHFGLPWHALGLLRLDGSGNVQWGKTFGGVKLPGRHAVQQTADQGYVVAGWRLSYWGPSDFWVARTDENGDISVCLPSGTLRPSLSNTPYSRRESAATVTESNATPMFSSAKVVATSLMWSHHCPEYTLYTLSVHKAGTGSGFVWSSPPGLNCGLACRASFPSNTTVTITASPDPGSVFVGWEGDCAGDGPTITIVMDADKSCTATFKGWDRWQPRRRLRRP